MPNNFKLPGLQKMSFKDFMNNDNYFSSDMVTESPLTEPITTLNSFKTAKALKTDPYSADTKYSLDSDYFQKTDVGVSPVEPSTPKKSVSMDETDKASMDAIPEFAKKKILGLSGDEFVALAGSLAQALAPDTAQGRIGGALSRFAKPIIEARRKAITEAPEQALTKRLTEAKIANLEKSEDPKTAISWYLKNNPKATPEEVVEFKKSLESDKPGSYWRTTSDDGTVTIYKGGNPVYTSKPGVGKTADKKLYATEEAGYQQAKGAIGKTKPITEKTRTPVNWSTASKSLSARFGKQDATGNFIITRDLQNAHRLAQKKLVELKGSGVEPLDAVNKAEDYARKVEERYWGYIDSAGIDFKTQKSLSRDQREANVKKTNEAFKKAYGYIPRIRPIR